MSRTEDSATSGKTMFSAKLTCPLGDPTKNYVTSFKVEEGILKVSQNFCTWEDFQIGRHAVVGSVMTGVGTFRPDGTWSAEGHDHGTLLNGDRYLGHWKEKGDPNGIRGTWKLLAGSGALEGITGEATFEEPAPKPGDTSVTAAVTGWYRLPNSRR